MKKFTLMMVAFFIISMSATQAQTYSYKITTPENIFSRAKPIDGPLIIGLDNPDCFFLDKEKFCELPALPFMKLDIRIEKTPKEQINFQIKDITEYISDYDVYMYKIGSCGITDSENQFAEVSFTNIAITPIYVEERDNETYIEFIYTPFRYYYDEKLLKFVSSFTLEITTNANSIEQLPEQNIELKSEKYYNLSGQLQQTPSRGVNIKVTEYVDGTRKTEKTIVK